LRRTTTSIQKTRDGMGRTAYDDDLQHRIQKQTGRQWGTHKKKGKREREQNRKQTQEGGGANESISQCRPRTQIIYIYIYMRTPSLLGLLVL
jgi:hypothetical protein